MGKIIGIDLGTTNSAMTVMQAGYKLGDDVIRRALVKVMRCSRRFWLAKTICYYY